MDYMLKILCLLFFPHKLDRGTVKAIYTRDVLLFVATVEAIIGSYILKNTLMQDSKNIVPALIVLIFIVSYFLSYSAAFILYISNHIVIKRLTFRECLKAIMPSRMTSSIYMIVNALIGHYNLLIFFPIVNAVMWLHQISMIVLYLRKLYFCSRKDLAVLVVLYATVMGTAVMQFI